MKIDPRQIRPTRPTCPTSRWLTAAALSISIAAPAHAAEARRKVDYRTAADPQGTIEIVNAAGRVSVVGWDRPEVTVSGTLDERVERIETTARGERTVIRVVQRKDGKDAGQAGQAILDVRVPRGATLEASTVSADLVVREVAGDQRLGTVSGEVDAELGAEASVRSVSGDLRLGSSLGTRRLKAGSVSGDVTISGKVGGRVEIETVSGDASLRLGTVDEADLKTVSGDLAAALALAPDGRVEAESVSGNLGFDFAGSLPAARYALQSFSGDIETCAAVRGALPQGAAAGAVGEAMSRRLEFRHAAAGGRVGAKTLSGDIRLCAPAIAASR